MARIGSMRGLSLNKQKMNVPGDSAPTLSSSNEKESTPTTGETFHSVILKTEVINGFKVLLTGADIEFIRQLNEESGFDISFIGPDGKAYMGAGSISYDEINLVEGAAELNLHPDNGWKAQLV